MVALVRRTQSCRLYFTCCCLGVSGCKMWAHYSVSEKSGSEERSQTQEQIMKAGTRRGGKKSMVQTSKMMWLSKKKKKKSSAFIFNMK